MQILAADIGGTRARLMLAEVVDGGFVELRRQQLASADFSGVAPLLDAFLHPGDAPQLACLAVAGPVGDQRVQLTNLPWQLDGRALAGLHGIKHFHLLNDFAAQAHGLPLLAGSELHTLQAGTPQAAGVRALLGPGTGLGMALLAPGTPPQVLASEGGHAGFAPQDAEQLTLCQHFLELHGHCSLELLLCGAGLERLHAFLHPQTPALPAAAIGAAALAGETLALATARLFVRLLLGAAADLALTSLARGGLYLGGGIAPRLLPLLCEPAALAAFHSRPPMQDLLRSIPLHVVRDDFLGLRGAAQVAATMACRSAGNE